ncbi:LysR family transcriptional regulator [Klebsiella sp. WOUb02]|uniref:LysR family transcriptional regulator n=1 Tax=Klebsiella sp. WOUb02 TaxID=3161071 RepID=UPI003CF7C6BB
MLDKLTGLRVFVAAVREGSFVAAADRLGMSPQMVARHIATLEKQLSARLLNRTTRKHSLTPAGSQYFRRCEAILQAIDDADSEANGAAESLSGMLRLNAPVTFGRYALVHFVSQFLQRYPQLRVELTLSDEVINPAAEGCDAAIRIGELDANLRLAAKPLSAYRLIACAAPRYLERRGWPLHPADLADHECLGFSPWFEGATHRWPFYSTKGLIEVEVTSRLIVNDWGAMLEAALKGVGVLIGYEKGLEQPIKEGRLVAILADYTFPERTMNLLYDPSRLKETRYRILVDELSDYFN